MSQAGRSADLSEILARFKFHSPVRVRFGETDANRHVNQVSYFVYIEQARMDYFAHLGLTDAVHDPFSQQTLIAADLACEFKAPVFFGQTLHVHARVTRLGRSSLDMEYALVETLEPRLVARARGSLVYFDRGAGRSTPLIPAIREAIARLEGLPA
ncbi:MAG TPA: thioesterase family protein [Candidatus Methylomirabilis sp.]|nr:thioesterase family protein [Candidatus Methylomirabilis sp.]